MIGKAPTPLRKRTREISEALDLLGYAANESDLSSLIAERALRIDGLRRAGGPASKLAQAEHDLNEQYEQRMKKQLASSKQRFAAAARVGATMGGQKRSGPVRRP